MNIFNSIEIEFVISDIIIDMLVINNVKHLMIQTLLQIGVLCELHRKLLFATSEN